MGKFSKIGRLVKDCIAKPIDVLCDWAREPLHARSHARSEQANRSAHEQAMERDELRIKTESDARMRENEHAVDLEIKRETEIKKALVELDEWKKDKDLERMKRTSEAVAAYQEKLTKLNVAAINALGNMQLELRERAQKLVYEKTVQYKELQDIAMNDAINDFKRIEDNFSSNERAKDILMTAADKKLANVIDTAARFLEELNQDIITLNKSITSLSEQGQDFIENHLNQFSLATNQQTLPNNEPRVINASPSSLSIDSK
ncbi:hypothetical protein [Halodesulfovibrio sp.]|jgi:predicted RNA-binding Zn ribbon-like protein|uniref:hypothetical protein n=1 Tax=Halodesulfovibrio sp. TaxID=1912772 RepID=UPI0025E4B474|nr:hypothetical protein [Halodesulfovibrio sp.]MCT4536044.1 hypothetical protein [Halodesulfovibrio sp.]